MPKTRDQLCRMAIDSFMTNAYCIQYHINVLTENKSQSLHTYEIEMPLMIKLYDVDTPHMINGITYPAGPVHCEQDLPNEHDFMIDFNQFFDNYALYERQPSHSGSDDILVRTSFIETTNTRSDNMNMTATILVKYAKQYKPFPIDHTPHNFEAKYNHLTQLFDEQRSQLVLLNRDNKHYRRRLNAVSKEYLSLKKEYEKTINSVHIKFASLQTIIKSMYEKHTLNEECPVCYEGISVDKLVVPVCGHFICSSCSSRCSSCPICRDASQLSFYPPDTPVS
jgi:hypothetical protein